MLEISIIKPNKEYYEIDLFQISIPHTLAKIAIEHGIYDLIWNPMIFNILTASDIIPYLEEAITLLREKGERNLLLYIIKYRDVCKKNIDSEIFTER